MKIVLLGYMGSGKTTVGTKLAKRLGLRFLDLDAYIEEIEEAQIAQLFAEKGEIYFRKLEGRALSEVLTRHDDFVLATGGGTPCYGTNMDTILSSGSLSIYLKVSVQGLADRLAPEAAHRPLIQRIPPADLPEFIGKHLFERNPIYARSQHTVHCDGKKAETIVDEIVGLLP